MSDTASEAGKKTLMEKARESIREAIFSGVLKPGEQIKESQLAEELKTSRFPIREALRSLEKEGLIETIPYRGSFVKQLTLKSVRELFSVRGALETLAVRLMVGRLTPEMVSEMKACFASMEALEQKGDLKGSAEEDLKFHRLIFEGSGNTMLLSVWDDLALHLKFLLLMGKSGYGIDAAYVRTHQCILEAIERRDAELAEAHVKVHISEGIDYLMMHSCYDLAPE